jgi:hypothetical protein
MIAINDNEKELIKAIAFTSFVIYEENEFKENLHSTMPFKIRFIQNNKD